MILAMLTDYIREAMRVAHYELMENSRFFATIPGLKGLWAEEATLEACREELQSTLEDWLMLGIRLGHELPIVAGIDLNLKAPVHAEAD
jgi:predicted RNase H-like HicB family nuclease